MNRYQPLLRNPGFRAVWGAAVVSGLGDRIATIALYLLIFDLTGNPVDLGLLAATQIIPAIVLGPVAGLVCDRLPRKSIMVAGDIVSALVVAAIPLVTVPAHIYLLAALLACGRQFSGPARLALLPDVVGAEHLEIDLMTEAGLSPQEILLSATSVAAECLALEDVGGTAVLADCSSRFGVEKFVFISSDKAVRPVSVMGATKRLAELKRRPP